MINGNKRPFDYVVIDCDGSHILVLGFDGAKKGKKKKKKKKVKSVWSISNTVNSCTNNME